MITDAPRTNTLEYDLKYLHSILTENDIKTTTSDASKTYLGEHYKQAVFSPSTRTVWYKGNPFGTAYQFGTEDGSVSGDVFGDVLSHNIYKKNGFVTGEGLKVESKDNAFVTGTYNYDSTTQSYLFTIGNGTSDDARSNAFSVNESGSVIAYSIDKTKLDSSYVTSLGENANMNIVMKALLNEPNYYKPTIEMFIDYHKGKTARSILVGETFAGFEFTGKLTSNYPKYYFTYIKNYINENNQLPVGVNLSDLGYTNCMMTDNGIKNTEEDVEFSILVANGISGTTLTKRTITPYIPKPTTESTTSLTPLYKDNYTINFKNSLGTETKEKVDGFKIDNVGVYNIINCSIVPKYDNPQNQCFQQLADKGVYVLADAPTNWTSDKITQCEDTYLIVEVGYNVVFGLFSMDTIEKSLSAALLKKVIEETSDASITSSLIKTYLITASKSDILPKSNTKVYFGKNKMGVSKYTDGKVKYFFFAFPTSNFSATNFDASNDFIHTITAKGLSEAALDYQQVIDNITINTTLITNGKDIVYKAYVGVLNFDTLNFDDENDAGANVRMKLNQTGLDTEYD